MILPTRDGIDPDKFLIRRCLHILMSVLKTEKTADKCIRSAHTILVAIKGSVQGIQGQLSVPEIPSRT